MKAIIGELQHAILVGDIEKKKIMDVVRKTCIERKSFEGSNLKKTSSN